VYDTKSGVIIGVSKSCEENFGIHYSLIYGNSKTSNELTIDMIAPDILL